MMIENDATYFPYVKDTLLPFKLPISGYLSIISVL